MRTACPSVTGKAWTIRSDESMTPFVFRSMYFSKRTVVPTARPLMLRLIWVATSLVTTEGESEKAAPRRRRPGRTVAITANQKTNRDAFMGNLIVYNYRQNGWGLEAFRTVSLVGKLGL